MLIHVNKRAPVFRVQSASEAEWSVMGIPQNKTIQWNLSVTTTSIIKFITCDLFSNVF